MLRPWTSYGERAAEVEELAGRIGLADKLNTLASQLSHGEVRQLEVSLALALKPRLLLLDEPGAGLSPGERVGIRQLLQRLPPDLTLVYVPEDRTIDILKEALPGAPLISWFNPRTGQNSPAVAVVGENSCQFPTPDPGAFTRP